MYCLQCNLFIVCTIAAQLAFCIESCPYFRAFHVFGTVLFDTVLIREVPYIQSVLHREVPMYSIFLVVLVKWLSVFCVWLLKLSRNSTQD